MDALASCYSNEGVPEEAEAILQDALEISRRVNGEDHEETNSLRYSLACQAALWGSGEEAISYLQEALARNYRGPSGCCGEPESILEDPDLTSLHGDPEFEAIVEELRRRNDAGKAAAIE